MGHQGGPKPQQAHGFGVLLRAWRQQAGLTQERLAEQAGLGVRTIRALELGQVRPRAETVRLLGAGLGLDGPARARFDAASRQADDRPPPALAATAGPSPTAPLAPAQLPADVAGFTGRGPHLDALDALLDDRGEPAARGQSSGVVISAIAGAAGVGKTALALHWAHRARERFGDGQLYVNLHGYAQGLPLSPLQALAQLLGALGVEADKIPVEVDQAAALYRSLLSERRMLVVLDNARDAEQVRPLVPGSPTCVLVVTSRSQLGGLVASHGARRLEVDVLTPDEAVSLLAWIVGRDRVDAEPRAAVELAQACGHLPLALRIAAANLTCQPDQPVAGYLARLRADDQLAELAVDGDEVGAVRTAFDCSYVTLEADAQRLFRLLGLVPGPEFTPAAAAALAGMRVGRAGRLLQRLAAAHLVEPRAPGRFGFHDLLRLYAHQLAGNHDSEQERQAAVGRLLEWYLHTTRAADRLLYPQKMRLPTLAPAAGSPAPAAGLEDRAEALTWLDTERACLVAATEHAAAHQQRPAAWLLADTLQSYFWERRHMLDWLAVAQAALRAAQADRDPQAQAAAHRTLGQARKCLGDYEQAAGHHRSALMLARQAGWVDGEAAALGNLGLVHSDLGQLQQAVDYHTQALALCQRIGHKGGQAAALGNLGDISQQLGRLEQAVDHLVQALALDREIGSGGGQAATLGTLGAVYRDLGRLDDAHVCLTQSLALARAVGNRYDEAFDLHSLASVQRDAGRWPLALEQAEAALAMAREIRELHLEADALNTLGSVELCLGRDQRAAAHHRAALDLARQISASYPRAEALLGLAATCRRLGQHDQAIEHAEQACGIAREAGFRILEGSAHAALAAVHLDLGHHDEAIGRAGQALAIHRETGHRLGQARALVVLGHGRRRTGVPGAARSSWQEASALLSDLGVPEAAQVRTLLGDT
jgi:tetratricopeptide (TPR) repeat protein/transcriptional regulator with XRE-family HTH domain